MKRLPAVRSCGDEESHIAFTAGGSRGLSSDINVTPMIDILLVLLIIFMAVTPVVPKGLEALVPLPTKAIASQMALSFFRSVTPIPVSRPTKSMTRM